MHLHFALAQFVQACPYGAAVAVRGADRPVDTLARLIGCMVYGGMGGGGLSQPCMPCLWKS